MLVPAMVGGRVEKRDAPSCRARARRAASMRARISGLAIGVERRERVEGRESVWRQDVGVFVREVAANLQS